MKAPTIKTVEQSEIDRLIELDAAIQVLKDMQKDVTEQLKLAVLDKNKMTNNLALKYGVKGGQQFSFDYLTCELRIQ